jgi:hypothetical protein
MKLADDIATAFLKSMGNPEDQGNIPTLAKELEKAFVDFIQAQNFEITEMKAFTDIEQITTNNPVTLEGTISSDGTTTSTGGGTGLGVTPGSPLTTVVNTTGTSKSTAMGGKKQILLNNINLVKRGSGTGGSISFSKGYTYIGDEALENNKNKVKLLKVTKDY